MSIWELARTLAQAGSFLPLTRPCMCVRNCRLLSSLSRCHLWTSDSFILLRWRKRLTKEWFSSASHEKTPQKSSLRCRTARATPFFCTNCQNCARLYVCVTAKNKYGHARYKKHIRFEKIKTIWITNRTWYKFSLEISRIATCALKFQYQNLQVYETALRK